MARTKFIIAVLLLLPALLSAQQTVKKDELSNVGTKITIEEMLGKLPGPKGEPYAMGMEHGTMQVLIYAPKGVDSQTPHSKDEVYVVFSGSGTFFDGRQRYPFKAGDVLFVPANTAHAFEKFTDDFVTWVVFYGKEGGEKE